MARVTVGEVRGSMIAKIELETEGLPPGRGAGSWGELLETKVVRGLELEDRVLVKIDSISAPIAEPDLVVLRNGPRGERREEVADANGL